MDLNPRALVIFLNLNRLPLNKRQFLQLSDPSLETLFAVVVQEAEANGVQNVHEAIPEDDHDHQHNQVKQGKLQNDEEAVEETQKQDCEETVKQDGETPGATFVFGVISSGQRTIKSLEFVPLFFVGDVVFSQFVLVLWTQVELVFLLIPQKHLFDLGTAWVAVKRIFSFLYVDFGRLRGFIGITTQELSLLLFLYLGHLCLFCYCIFNFSGKEGGCFI